MAPTPRAWARCSSSSVKPAKCCKFAVTKMPQRSKPKPMRHRSSVSSISILYQAIQDRASDIHFEPFENEFKIRYRVDGALYEMSPPPRHLALPVISRVKVMANMNIAERRLPQDGRIQKNIAGRHVDLRVSTLPTQFGESVVLRVLDRSTVNLDLEMLECPITSTIT